jgi:hypothetical protein
MHQVVNDLIRGQRVTLAFGSDAELRHVLEVLHEVATSRQLSVRVEATGRRHLELSLAAPPD